MMKNLVLMALPAAAMAFGPAMPLASAPALARSVNCRYSAPALRMAVTDIGSESELDSAIANAGLFYDPTLPLSAYDSLNYPRAIIF